MQLRKISAVAITAALLLSGCGEKENTPTSKPNESRVESRIEDVLGGESTQSQPEASEPEEVKIEMTDEIKNAALNSGLVQLNNDVFQRGGYITVADFVEKYKDSYDITYSCPTEAGTYDECKDYLLEYYEGIFQSRANMGTTWQSDKGRSRGEYYLTLTPKNGGKPVIAYVVNATSPDEKITLDKAIVAEIEPNYKDADLTAHIWFPMGFSGSKFKDESENKSYTVKTIGETLEAMGLTKKEDKPKGSGIYPNLSYSEHYNTYFKRGENYECYVLGEENLFGAKPIYFYRFEIDPNTDKLDSVRCTLELFVK